MKRDSDSNTHRFKWSEEEKLLWVEEPSAFSTRGFKRRVSWEAWSDLVSLWS